MVLFFLHYLGGSGWEWRAVTERLAPRVRCVAIDLPGFGDAAAVGGYSVAEMARYVEQTIREAAPARWMLAGHSMGAKVAAAVARHVEDGRANIDGLAGLALIAGSPPSSEPMPEEQRKKMLGWFTGDAESNRADARTYVAANSGSHLSTAWVESAVVDVLRANRQAWRAWLTGGSREDWSDRVGVLRTPAIVIAGGDDENLGPQTQARSMLPHFMHATSATIEGVKHLLPMEAPTRVAILLEDHLRDLAGDRFGEPRGMRQFDALIDSDRVGTSTRRALVERARSDEESYEPVAISAEALVALRAVIARVIPQAGRHAIDLAARIDAQLHDGAGDGWRFAALPRDTEAYRAALFSLDAIARRRYDCVFAALDQQRADQMLHDIARGDGNAVREERDNDAQPLNDEQMRRWFEDLRADAIKLYVAHPRTLARIGYSGIANGGDGIPKSGFIGLGVGVREAWEPLATPDHNA